MTIVEEIQKLKQEKNAVILAHYYVRPEIQDIADYIGDSFYLSKVAVGLKEQTIVFCGVSFMGESAKVLNPEKTVLMPDMHADCAMAHMADADTIQKMRDTYEDLAVVCYINSTAELKTHSDVCVTSANAVKIVKELPTRIFSSFRTETWRILWQSRYRRRTLYTTKAIARSMRRCRWKRSKKQRHSIRMQKYCPIRNVRKQCWRFPIMWEAHPGSLIMQQKAKTKNLLSVRKMEFATNWKRTTRARSFILQRQSLSAQI